MVLLSFVLVIVAAVTLVIGLLTSGLPLVFISIGCSAVAGVVLIAAVLRSRPRAVSTATGPSPLAAAGDASPWAPEVATADGEVAEAIPAGGFAAGLVFPIDDYDDLKVGEITPLLSELDVDELEAVRDRENRGKKRASILARVDVLLKEQAAEEVPAWTAYKPEPSSGAAVDFPIAEYDELKVGEITPLLSQLEDDELRLVRAYEKKGKARAGILARIDSLIAPAKKAAPTKKAPSTTSTAKKAPSTTSTAKKATGAKKTTTAAKKAAPVKKAPAKKVAAKKTAAKKSR